MSAPEALHEHFVAAARRHAERTAVVEPGKGAITYGELATLTDRLRDRLAALGVRPGDRVGIYMRKSIDAVAAIYGMLKAGAAYVPVDPSAPAARNAYILHNCAVKAVVDGEPLRARSFAPSWSSWARPPSSLIDDAGAGSALRGRSSGGCERHARRRSPPSSRVRPTSPTSSTPPARPASPRA